jgi:phage-related protein
MNILDKLNDYFEGVLKQISKILDIFLSFLKEIVKIISSFLKFIRESFPETPNLISILKKIITCFIYSKLALLFFPLFPNVILPVPPQLLSLCTS